MSTENWAVLYDMLKVALLLCAAKIIALVKELLVAYYYGTNAVVDGYLFVFNLAQWPVSIFGSVTAIALIPYLVKIQKTHLTKSVNLNSALLTLSLWLGVAISVAFGLIMWWALREFDLGLTDRSRAAALLSLPWVAGGVVCAFVGIVLSNWLMSQRQHANTFLESMPAAMIAICLLLSSVTSNQVRDAWPLAVGTFLGFLMQTILLSAVDKKSIQFGRLGVLKKHWPAIRRSFGLMLIAQIFVTSAGVLDQFVAVRMGEGVLASYSYAQRIMTLVLGLTSVVVLRAMLPILSKVSDINKSLIMASYWAWRLAFFGVLGAIILCLLSEWVVEAIFQRGAFNQSDTSEVSAIFGILVFQLPFYLFHIVFIQWTSSANKIVLYLVAAMLMIGAKLLGLLIWFKLGALGLALSNVLMYGIGGLVIFAVIRLYMIRLA